MSSLDLEQRYRRVLRLLPGYYRDTWEEDMVAAFLDSWLTGDPDEDSVTMEFDRPSWPEVASVAGLAGITPAGPAALAVLAALALSCAGCSHILPLGPAPAVPRQLASAIILQRVLSQPPSPAGGCPAGYTTLSAPFTDYPEVPDACYRDLGQPVTVTSAAVAMSYQPASNQQPAVYGLTFTLPAAEAPALAAITAKAFESRDQMAISTAGKTWGVTVTGGPLTHGQFGIWVQSKNQVLQLERELLPPA